MEQGDAVLDLQSRRVPRRKDEVSMIECGAEVLIHDKGHKRVVVLNSTARFILERCDGSRSLGDLGREMAEQFAGVDHPTLLLDLDATLERLASLQLVEYGPSQAS